EEILHSIKYLGDFLLGNDGIENLQAARPEAAVESDEELLAGSEVFDDITELKKRRRRR
ncbi:hypothetical protein DHEL01_v203965, partial [Diaporthe helianthi]